jgi:hypothetical protein
MRCWRPAAFLAEPRRARVITAKLIIYLLGGAGYALACVLVSLAVALPWLAARGCSPPGLPSLAAPIPSPSPAGTSPDHVTASPPARVPDAVGLDMPSVDRGLLISFADAGQVREEVRPVGDLPGVESCTEFAEDLSPGMQALGFGPGLQVGIPWLA